MRITCPNCKKEFDVADRATAVTNVGAENQIIYCSVKCKRQAGNRRYYAAHREAIIKRNLRNQRCGKNEHREEITCLTNR